MGRLPARDGGDCGERAMRSSGLSKPSSDESDQDGLDGFSFRTWPFYWLTRASGRYLQAMETALKRAGLDVPRWRVLMVLHEEGCASVSEIADHAISKLPTMTKIVQRMQADGLVMLRPRSSDGRVTEVLLTPTGEAAAERAWQIADRIFGRAFARMSKTETATLTKLLMKLASTLADDLP